MSNNTFGTSTLIVSCGDHPPLKVVFDVTTLNITIVDGARLIKSKKEVKALLSTIMESGHMSCMRNAGYRRKESSLYHEWASHVTLYRWGLLKRHITNINLSDNVSWAERISYLVLSWFCPQ